MSPTIDLYESVALLILIAIVGGIAVIRWVCHEILMHAETRPGQLPHATRVARRITREGHTTQPLPLDSEDG